VSPTPLPETLDYRAVTERMFAAAAHLIQTRAGAARLIARISDRVEVRMHGPCVGAGIELRAFAGRVIAPDATFRLPR
jgi:hypothetical protein